MLLTIELKSSADPLQKARTQPKFFSVKIKPSMETISSINPENRELSNSSLEASSFSKFVPVAEGFSNPLYFNESTIETLPYLSRQGDALLVIADSQHEEVRCLSVHETPITDSGLLNYLKDVEANAQKLKDQAKRNVKQRRDYYKQLKRRFLAKLVQKLKDSITLIHYLDPDDFSEFLRFAYQLYATTKSPPVSSYSEFGVKLGEAADGRLRILQSFVNIFKELENDIALDLFELEEDFRKLFDGFQNEIFKLMNAASDSIEQTRSDHRGRGERYKKKSKNKKSQLIVNCRWCAC
eukprot:TRINITY_DN526_c0_g3_i15.p1 TRINITY_DN526_c0_g3~~TRINITY_DN526_c0_g3_i15.p1  ORF type:complete len:296 (+),score=16.53 TRINITY_DN526_c0_g3_i15:212-1099(+)